MAEILTPQRLLEFKQYEPKRKFRWVLEIDGLDAFVMKTAARPQATFEETVIDYVNAKRWISGKMSWNPISVTLHDPIAPSAAQKVMEWVRRNYEMLTGRMGYAVVYKETITLKLLDPQGAVVEQWELEGAWPMDVNWGDLDYATSDNTEITMSIRFDNATLQF
jgi:hypothetical protein